MNFKKQKISAFFLLGVFLVTLLNSVVPHAHHLHETTDSIAFTPAHSHEKEHHHHHSETDAVCEFHECHTHDYHIHELLPVTINKTQKVQKSGVFPLLLPYDFNFNKSLTYKQKNKVFHKEKPYKHLYVLSTPLRGPPFLV